MVGMYTECVELISSQNQNDTCYTHKRESDEDRATQRERDREKFTTTLAYFQFLGGSSSISKTRGEQSIKH